ncbi:hypothetical protein KXQ82_10020 [Mucilaginibacter sp. HMF5004]|uniref:hypothetical protein n=1 Tax=Mucilaginibacter rivuli TaxID=2857527 RepID=UPI001C603FF1|nr:hypothetical protein [Mucilaginibacter rivuli]MBW4890054.1 hypothetical protein [Mucilaginibacter rivuli]
MALRLCDHAKSRSYIWCKQDAWVDKNVQQHFSKFTGQQLKFSLQADDKETLQYYKSTQNDREYQFWERRPYKSTMYNRSLLEQKLDYIHHNPVRKNLCQHAEEYVYSSAGYYINNIDDTGLITHYMEHI